MIKPGYKRLGDYIEPLDERNTNLSVKLSQGICNNKYFITPRQVAENSANDKIVRTGQFAYNRATTRNGDKISIAYREGPDCTVSSAYQIFRIKDENKLNPHYLWMWFRRPEFDRYARFKSRGSAHEFFEWDEMCEVYLPIPDIDEQRRIVAEYQAVEKRIATNEALIAKLEETAQTIYKKMFVDDIDPEMLPHGWRMGTLAELAGFRYGKLPEKHNESEEYHVPIYSGYAVTGYTNEVMFSDRVVVIIARGDAGTGRICLSPKECFLTNLAIAIITKDSNYTPFLYYYLSNSDTYSLRSGSAQAQITVNSLIPYKVLIPPVEVCKEFKRLISPFYDYSDSLNKEIKVYEDVKSVLLSRLTISA